MAEERQMERDILTAAEELFLEKGSASTSTVEIARRAGCNQTLVHYYFRSKEKLFQAIFERKFGIFFRSFEELADTELPFTDKVRRFIEVHYRVIAENPRLPLFLLNEMTRNPGRIELLKQRFAPGIATIFGRFDREMRAAVKRGEIRDMGTLELFLTIVSLNISIFLMNPVLRGALDIPDGRFATFAAERKQQNIELVLSSLRPDRSTE